MDVTKFCEDHKPRRRTTSVLLELKETKRCSTLVKILILAIALLIICCLILLNLYLIERTRSKAGVADNRVKSTSRSPALEKYYGGSCWTTVCLHAVSDLLNSVDASVDPCKDFYRFACGGWMKRHPRPPSSDRWNPFKKLTTENNEVIEMLLRDKELKAIYSKEEAVWKALAYYDSCMDVDEIERLKGEPLMKLIKEYGSWSITDKNWEEKDWDFVTNLARIHKDLASLILFSMRVLIDEKNSSQNVITFRESYTSLSRRELFSNYSKSLQIREAYKGLMRNLTRKLGASEDSEAPLLEIFQFQKELAKISTPRFKMPSEQAYKKLTLSQLQNYTGSFVNWTKYVAVMMEDNSFQVDSQTKVVVYSLEYLRRLVKLLSKTPKRTIANYLMWKVVESKYTQLSSDFTEILKSYYLQAFSYWRDSDNNELCLMTTTLKFGIPLSKVFLDQKFYGDSKKLAMDIIEDIRGALISNIGQVKWMDDETREAAIKKAEAIIENVGYPDYIVDTKFMARKYKQVKINAKTYFDNDISVSKNMNLDKLAKAGAVVDKTDWPFPPTALNAFYSDRENKMGKELYFVKAADQ